MKRVHREATREEFVALYVMIKDAAGNRTIEVSVDTKGLRTDRLRWLCACCPKYYCIPGSSEHGFSSECINSRVVPVTLTKQNGLLCAHLKSALWHGHARVGQDIKTLFLEYQDTPSSDITTVPEPHDETAANTLAAFHAATFVRVHTKVLFEGLPIHPIC